MLKGAIYDLDDLMVNSDQLHVRAWDLLMKEYGHRFSDLPQEMRSRFIGMRVSDVLKEIISHFNLKDDA